MTHPNNLEELRHEEEADVRAFGKGCLIIFSLIALAFLLYPVLVSIK